jgi:hypothetical protein
MDSHSLGRCPNSQIILRNMAIPFSFTVPASCNDPLESQTAGRKSCRGQSPSICRARRSVASIDARLRSARYAWCCLYKRTGRTGRSSRPDLYLQTLPCVPAQRLHFKVMGRELSAVRQRWMRPTPLRAADEPRATNEPDKRRQTITEPVHLPRGQQ